MELTKQEEIAIKALKKVSKNWPKSLWLFSANGTLCVMRKNEQGQHAILESWGIDPTYIVDDIDIENAGGDW